MTNKKLEFEDLIEVYRPTLGRDVDVLAYRALRCSILNFLGITGNSKLYSAGKYFGEKLYVESFEELVEFFKELKIGILEVIDEEPLKLRIYECANCAGLPNIGKKICCFEAGLLAGVLKNILNKDVHVVEVKCYASGDDCCEFEVRVLED
ncbi:V4R domain-containing protein [Methanotorris formicicus]|uniref:4-vinyl reductase 4VR n=1 Tax=Methanotorris formicicus Mc-S-70 TaxID=647171 RepID=H1KW48_9EURY|nr:V4R domain-containing protein [Methanotorris formicicus]EHP89631.1 4-vinyl reductase 4VR [Methanotorris formicicus Mc-S-70]